MFGKCNFAGTKFCNRKISGLCLESFQCGKSFWFLFSEPVRIPVLPLHREFLFPQTRYCKPYSVIYKKVTSMEEDFDSVKAIVEKLNKILGTFSFSIPRAVCNWCVCLCVFHTRGGSNAGHVKPRAR